MKNKFSIKRRFGNEGTFMVKKENPSLTFKQSSGNVSINCDSEASSDIYREDSQEMNFQEKTFGPAKKKTLSDL
jgi:hypothetical protein